MNVLGKKLLYVVNILIIIFLVGCVSFISLNQVSDLRMGMKKAEVDKILLVKPSEFSNLKINNKKYYVYLYNLSTGNYSANYLIAYNSDSELIYWGYPAEFERSNNKILNIIAEHALYNLQKVR